MPALPTSRIAHALPVLAWNALLALVGLLLVAAIGEVYFRIKLPFVGSSKSRQFVKDVGYLYEPYVEVRSTNMRDFWTISRANSLGFLDREPLSPQRTAESCHIAVIGDSFVEASEVPIEAKFHVRLEREARRKLPDLDVTTSAFGRSGSGPVDQLPFYDHYVRPLRPNLLVLAMVSNDFADSSPFLRYWDYPVSPDPLPTAYAVRSATGEIQLRRPERSPAEFANRSSGADIFSKSFFGKILSRHARTTYNSLIAGSNDIEWEECICCPNTSSDKRFAKDHDFSRHFLEELHGPCKDAFDFLGFALGEFQELAHQDGINLVILATDSLWIYPRFGEPSGQKAIKLMMELIEPIGIPVVDQYKYIVRQGGRVEDGYFPEQGHWNAQGHQWAAEALLEYLEQNQSICDTDSAVAGTP